MHTHLLYKISILFSYGNIRYRIKFSIRIVNYINIKTHKFWIFYTYLKKENNGTLIVISKEVTPWLTDCNKKTAAAIKKKLAKFAYLEPGCRSPCWSPPRRSGPRSGRIPRLNEVVVVAYHVSIKKIKLLLFTMYPLKKMDTESYWILF